MMNKAKIEEGIENINEYLRKIEKNPDPTISEAAEALHNLTNFFDELKSLVAGDDASLTLGELSKKYDIDLGEIIN